MTPADILVCGASIAGPAAAYWLTRAGHRVTVVERAADFRTAGQNVDVRGPARDVLRLMGVEDAALAANTGEIGLRFVDERGTALADFPAGTGGSDGMTAQVEVLRGTLAQLLRTAGEPDVDYLMGDRVAALTQDADGVDVTFAGGTVRRFDLVVIADGVRSSTRDLVFDDVETRDIGLYTAYGTIPRTADDDQWWTWFNAPGGRSVTVRPDNVGTTRVALSFVSPPAGLEEMTPQAQREALRTRYDGAGWRAPDILDALDSTDELYVDYLGQVRAARWSEGRVVLCGDAAWCATPISGMGTSLALTGAYVLGGELAGAGDHHEAFVAYRNRMRPLVDAAQKLPPGVPRIAHPKTRAGVRLLRTAVRLAGSPPVRFVAGHLPSIGKETDESLPQYAFEMR